MSNQIVTSSPTSVKVVHTSSHTVLSDEKTPSLGGDLDANGNALKNVSDIEVKTINGEDFGTKLSKFFSDIKETIKGFASRDHSHQEFDIIQKYIDKKIEENKPEPAAAPSHTHTFADITGDLPLSRVTDGEKIKKFMESSFAEKSHDHPDMKTHIGTLVDAIEGLRGIIVEKSSIDNILLRLRKVEEILAMPKIDPPTPPVEIVVRVSGEEQILIPKKCDGLALLEVSAKSVDGGMAYVTVKMNENILEIPSRVSSDSILNLTSDKPCLCRLLFR